MSRKMLIAGSLILLAIVVLFVYFHGDTAWFGADNTTPDTNQPSSGILRQIHLNMNGVFMNTYGDSKRVSLILDGAITENSDSHDFLNITFDFSDNFPYQLQTPEGGFCSTNQENNELDYLYICRTEAYNQEAKTNTHCVFAISVAKQYCLMLFEDKPNYCLAVSADAAADTQALQDYFNEFIQSYAWESWKEDESAVEHITPINLSLDAIKCNANGTEFKTVAITVNGRILTYRSGESRLDAAIGNFDGFIQFQASTNANSGIVGLIQTTPYADYFLVSCSALEDGADSAAFFMLYFSPDMDKWMLMNLSDKVLYVSSASGNSTTQELLEYFQGTIPSNWKSDNN